MGGFAPRIVLPGGVRARAVNAGDFDGDGQPDFVVANGDSNEVWLLLNRTSSLIDLGVTVTDGQESVFRGAAVSYTVDVSNAGPSSATGLSLAVTVPLGLTGTTMTPSTGTFDPESGTWTGLNLEPGGHAVLTMSGVVGASAVGDFLVRVVVSAPPGTIDPALANNIGNDVDSVLKGYADLSVSLTNGTTALHAGDAMSYTAVMTNAGPTAVENAWLG